jgi:predicted ATPase
MRSGLGCGLLGWMIRTDDLALDRFVIISGCSGGGKSSLLAELGWRGHAVVEEPGRRIVREELAGAGVALPWRDAEAFLRRAVSMALADLASMRGSTGWVFLDRGLIDAAVGLRHVTGESVLDAVAERYRFHRRVFLAPPWPEIYVADGERRHDVEFAIAECGRLAEAYSLLGYEVIILPKIAVGERADFVIATLGG